MAACPCAHQQGAEQAWCGRCIGGSSARHSPVPAHPARPKGPPPVPAIAVPHSEPWLCGGCSVELCQGQRSWESQGTGAKAHLQSWHIRLPCPSLCLGNGQTPLDEGLTWTLPGRLGCMPLAVSQGPAGPGPKEPEGSPSSAHNLHLSCRSPGNTLRAPGLRTATQGGAPGQATARKSRRGLGCREQAPGAAWHLVHGVPGKGCAGGGVPPGSVSPLKSVQAVSMQQPW